MIFLTFELRFKKEVNPQNNLSQAEILLQRITNKGPMKTETVSKRFDPLQVSEAEKPRKQEQEQETQPNGLNELQKRLSGRMNTLPSTFTKERQKGQNLVITNVPMQTDLRAP